MQWMASWIESEILGSEFKDQRLTARFRQIMSKLASSSGQTIPQICEDWAATKAMYRFLSNDRVDESEILSGHFSSTFSRIEATESPVLILHDTCEFTYKRENAEELGFTRKIAVPKRYREGRKLEHQVCGLLMHASLAITQEGLPLGLTSAKFWTRKVFKNTAQMKRHINPTRIPIEAKESVKWLENIRQTHDNASDDASKFIHIGDRESDIYELFKDCDDLGSYFIARSCVNRFADDSTICEVMNDPMRAYKHQIEFIDGDGKSIIAGLEVKVQKVSLHPPKGKEKAFDDVGVFIVSAVERSKPKDREQIRWNFLTNLPIKNKKDAIQVLEWYKQRWKIETFFKIMKSGFKAEESKLRTADRLARLLAIIVIMSWRIQWTTMMARAEDNIRPELAFDITEVNILKKFYKIPQDEHPNTQAFVVLLARLGGYLARSNDLPPGIIVIWRGFRRLNDLREGFELRSG